MMQISKDIIEKRLSKVFYKKSVRAIMDILVGSDGVTQEDIIIRKNGKLQPGTVITVPTKTRPFSFTESNTSQKKHNWKRKFPRRPGQMSRIGGSSSYVCTECGEERHCNSAYLQKKGCK